MISEVKALGEYLRFEITLDQLRPRIVESISFDFSDAAHRRIQYSASVASIPSPMVTPEKVRFGYARWKALSEEGIVLSHWAAMLLMNDAYDFDDSQPYHDRMV